MRVLLLAETCNPNWASLPSFSYYLAKSISKYVDIVLVTHIRNKEDIDKENTDSKLKVVYIDNEYIAAPLFWIGQQLRKVGVGGWMTSMALKYPANIAFEYEVWKRFKNELKAGDFDFIHRISPVSPTVPSPIASWSDVPFIYGPINGTLPWPEQFKDEIKKEREIISFLRGIYKYFPYYKSTFDNAVKILAAFKHVETDIPQTDLHKVIKFDELGIYPDFYKPNSDSNLNKFCQFLFVGRLVPYKCPDVVIQAFASSHELQNNHKLIIVGDGPERGSLEKLIHDHQLTHCVEIVGWKTQEEVADYMSNSDIFAFPTIREVGGNVILEAMSAGLPCIVPDYGGPSELVSPTNGIKVPLSDKDEFIQGFKFAMEKLAKDKLMRNELADNARKQVMAEHDWDKKGYKVMEIYNSLK